MDLLLILTYAALAYGAFRLFKIPVNPFTLLTAALGGIALLATLILGMNYNHPFSAQGRFYFTTTPILPTVSGRVVEVPVESGQEVKAGEVLFRLDPERYANALKAAEAAVADAEQAVGQLRATADAARSNYEAAVAARDAAKDLFERSQKLIQSGAISQAQFKQTEERYLGAEARTATAQSEFERATLDATAAIEGVNTEVARLRAERDSARYDLEQTEVRAPTDGVVFQMFLRPGMFVVPAPLRPALVFLHAEEPTFAAAFLQNSSQRIIEGAEAEVIFPAVPGRFFKARVDRVGAYIPQGQLQPSGQLIDPSQIEGEGRIIVRIKIEEDLSRFQIVPGSVGNVAIYTEHMHHLAILRKVLLRMKSWMNFLFGEGHGGGGGGGH